MDNDFIEQLNKFINDNADLQGLHSTINSFIDSTETVTLLDTQSPTPSKTFDMMGNMQITCNYTVDVKSKDPLKAYQIIYSIASLLRNQKVNIQSANDSFALNSIKVSKVGEPLVDMADNYLFSLPITANLDIFVNIN